MSATNKLGKGMKFLSVILGSLLMGFMWRARGSHGFGSFWGIVAVGGIFTLLIFAFYGNRAKMKYELMPMGAIMMGITVPAWGCVISMPGGIFGSTVPFSAIEKVSGSGSQVYAQIGQGRGTIMMLLLGFSLICLYGIFAGSFFSEKEYKIKHYLVFIAVFFAVEILAKTTFAHNIMNVLAPEVTDGFNRGLADAGVTDTLRHFYLFELLKGGTAKGIPFGRCYFECIEHIAYTAAALALLITALAVFRDKNVFAVSLLINVFSAIAITAADYFQICNYESSFLSKLNIPASLRITSWGLWEFATGLILGFGIMLTLAVLPEKYSSGKKYRSEPYIDNKVMRFILNFLLWGFVFVVVPVRTLALRVARMLEDYGRIQDEDVPGIAATAVLSVIICVFLFITLKKNILGKNLPVPFKLKSFEFARIYLLILSLYYGAVYFFTLDASIPAFIRRTITSPSHHADMTGIEYFFIYLAAFALFEIIYIPVKKRLSSHH